jgi:hypothetical protein
MLAPSTIHPFIVGVQSTSPFFWVLKYFTWLIPMMADPSYWDINKMPKLRAVFEFRYDIGSDIDKIPRFCKKLSIRLFINTYSTILRRKRPYRELTREELIEEAITLLSAGSDTVGHTTVVGVFQFSQ